MYLWLFWAFESLPRWPPSIIEALEEGLGHAVLILPITALTVPGFFFFFKALNKEELKSPCFSDCETSAI